MKYDFITSDDNFSFKIKNFKLNFFPKLFPFDVELKGALSVWKTHNEQFIKNTHFEMIKILFLKIVSKC
jgi:hypothetical protein